MLMSIFETDGKARNQCISLCLRIRTDIRDNLCMLCAPLHVCKVQVFLMPRYQIKQIEMFNLTLSCLGQLSLQNISDGYISPIDPDGPLQHALQSEIFNYQYTEQNLKHTLSLIFSCDSSSMQDNVRRLVGPSVRRNEF